MGGRAGGRRSGVDVSVWHGGDGTDVSDKKPPVLRERAGSKTGRAAKANAHMWAGRTRAVEMRGTRPQVRAQVGARPEQPECSRDSPPPPQGPLMFRRSSVTLLSKRSSGVCRARCPQLRASVCVDGRMRVGMYLSARPRASPEQVHG